MRYAPIQYATVSLRFLLFSCVCVIEWLQNDRLIAKIEKSNQMQPEAERVTIPFLTMFSIKIILIHVYRKRCSWILRQNCPLDSINYFDFRLIWNTHDSKFVTEKLVVQRQTLS